MTFLLLAFLCLIIIILNSSRTPPVGVKGANQVSLAAAQSRTFFSFDYNGTIAGQDIRASAVIDAYYYMDGSLLENVAPPFNFGPFQPAGGFEPIHVTVPMNLCSNNRSHWNTIFYDPSFGVFFSAVSPPGSKESKNGKTIGLAVGITFGVLVVAIVVVIILAILVKPVREFFRPFTRRDHARKAGKGVGPDSEQLAPADSRSTQTGWSNARKPDQ